MGDRFLIVNADDFGLHRGANRAILECHREGIVTSASLLVNSPASLEAAILAAQAPSLGVGLHLNLTQGRPLSRGGEAIFGQRSRIVWRALAGSFQDAALVEEIRAQWDACLALGFEPTHLDGHDHVHVLPGIFELVAAFAMEKRVPVRLPAESPLLRPGGWASLGQPKPWTTLTRKVLLALWAGRARRHAQRIRCRTNDHFRSVFGFWPPIGIPEPHHYERILRGIPDGVSELMVHPAHPGGDLGWSTAIEKVSLAEAEILRRPSLRRLVEQLGLKLVTYRQLSGPSTGRSAGDSSAGR